MNEQVYCRITSKGNYLGYNCPVEGLSITYSTYKLLKTMGLQIEIYDPVKEAKEKEAKKNKEQEAKMQQTRNNLLEKAIKQEEQKHIMPDADYIDQDMQDSIEYLRQNKENEVDPMDDEVDKILNDQLQVETASQFEEVPYVEEKVLRDKFYTTEELQKKKYNELIAILVVRGHIGGRDKMAPRQKDKKEDLIKKILDTQFEE